MPCARYSSISGVPPIELVNSSTRSPRERQVLQDRLEQRRHHLVGRPHRHPPPARLAVDADADLHLVVGQREARLTRRAAPCTRSARAPSTGPAPITRRASASQPVEVDTAFGGGADDLLQQHGAADTTPPGRGVGGTVWRRSSVPRLNAGSISTGARRAAGLRVRSMGWALTCRTRGEPSFTLVARDGTGHRYPRRTWAAAGVGGPADELVPALLDPILGVVHERDGRR